MKNKLLSVVVVLLIISIYILDELPGRRREEKRQLFDPDRLGELILVQTRGVRIKKQNGVFLTKDGQPVDSAKIDYFFSILSSIRIKRILPSKTQLVDEHHFFPNPDNRFVFTFENNRLVFVLGEKIKTDQSFYVKLIKNGEQTWLIAHDPSAMEGLVLKESESVSSRKYDRIRNLLFLDNDFFEDRYIFGREDLFSLLNVHLSNKRNRPFQLGFSPPVTIPPPFSSISIDSSSFVRFKESLENLTARRIHPRYQKDLLKDKLSGMVLEMADKTFSLELFGNYKGLDGYFLLSRGDRNLYELNRKDTSIFFLNRQDFWNKNPLPTSFGNKDEIFVMSFKNVRFKLKLSTKGNIESLDGKQVAEKSFDDLFSLLAHKADYLSKRKGNTQNKEILVLDFDDFSIRVILKNREFLVVNKDIFYHYGTNERIPVKKEDYFPHARSFL